MKKTCLLLIPVVVFLFACGESVKDKLAGKWNVVDVGLTDPDKNPKLADQLRQAKVSGVHRYTFYDFMPDGRYDMSIAGDTMGGRWFLEEGDKYLLLKNKQGEIKWELTKVDQEELIMVQQKAGGMICTMKKIEGWQE